MTPNPNPSPELREAIARQIDPVAFDEDGLATYRQARRDAAFRAADRVAALSPQTLPAPGEVEPDDADRANGIGQGELVVGLKRALQHPAGDHDGWTDAGMEHAFFRWPVIVAALNTALSSLAIGQDEPCNEDGTTDFHRVVSPSPTAAEIAALRQSEHSWKINYRATMDVNAQLRAENAELRATLATVAAANDEGVVDKGNHDCLAKRRPGEPMFILLGRDPDAWQIVRAWAARRLNAGGDPEHSLQGMKTANAMREYAADPSNRPASAPDASAYPRLEVVAGEGLEVAAAWHDAECKKAVESEGAARLVGFWDRVAHHQKVAAFHSTSAAAIRLLSQGGGK